MTPVDNKPGNSQAVGELDRYSGRRPSMPWRALSTGAGVLSSEGLTAYLHPALGEALAVADIVIPLILAIILLTAILRGSSQTCERVFRLLRWIANRPEPPAPEEADR
jgi:hypothetical protein